MAAKQPGALFELMLESIQDCAIFMIDPEGWIASWNAGGERITGYRAEEVLNSHVSRLYAPAEAAAGVPTADAKLAAERGHFVAAGWRIRRDGTRFWAEATMTVLRNPEGRLLGFVQVLRDRPDRDPQAEESLRSSEERLRRFIEHVPVAIAMFDREMRYLQASRRWIEDHGLAGREIVGRRQDEVAQSLPERWMEIQNRCLAGVTEFSEESRVQGPDGSPEWTRWTVRPWLHSAGDPGGVIVHSEAITEQRRTEERYRLVVEATHAAMILIDLEGTIVLVNAQVEAMFGYKRRELIGRPISMLVPERLRDRSGAFLDPRSPGSGDLYGLTRSGTEFPMEFGVGPIGTPEGALVLVTMTDIAARKSFERRLTAANLDLERKLRERTAIAESQAAKLRELSGLLILVEQRERQNLADALHRHLQQLLVAARLGLNRIQRATKEPDPRAIVVNVERLIDEALNVSKDVTSDLVPPLLNQAGLLPAIEWLARWMKEKHGLEVAIDVQVGPPALSEERRILLFQSVRELLMNVVRHAGVGTAQLLVTGRDRTLRVVVEDRGKGFEYGRVRPKSDSAGGFGLRTARERLEMLGGRLTVASRPGHGAVITLEAPLEESVPSRSGPAIRAAVSSTPAEASAPGAGERIRVLVADDHIILRQGLVRALQDYPDIEVAGEAGDGREAVAKALAFHPNIVIMDISMPVMDGIEATRKIKEAKPSIKIIGLSIQEAEELAQTMIHAGANAYLSKTGPIDELVKAIRRTWRAVPAMPVRS